MKGELPIKIHVDCGQASEQGWYNVDGLGTATPIGESKGADILCNAHTLPRNGQAALIRVWRVLERLNDNKLPEFLADVEETLAPGGTLELKIINHDSALELAKAHPPLNRIMFGPHRQYTWHVRKWTPEELIEYVTKFGLRLQSHYSGVEEYPCFIFTFVKPKSLAAKDYALTGRKLSGKILEIGPGAHPLPGADTYFDIDQKFLDGLPGRTVKGDVHSLPFADKEFDYVFCAHVLEHCASPITAAAEISRVGKAGTVVLPSIYKEFLFGFEEEDHRWLALNGSQEDTVYLRERNPEFVERFDKDYQSVMCKMFRAGRFDTHERRVLQNWFRNNEPSLDVIVHWTDRFKVKFF